MDQAEENTVTIRIKQIFFDRIASLEKKLEWRANSTHWSNHFNKNPKFAKFHFQRPGIFLIVEILAIDLVQRPERFEKVPYLQTPELFRITLGKILRRNLTIQEAKGDYDLAKELIAQVFR